MDDIKSGRNKYGSPPSSVSNAGNVDTVQPQQQPFGGERFTADTHAAQYHSQDTETANTHNGAYTLDVAKKSGKKRSFFLVLFIILFIAASAFAAWQYMQVRDLQKQVDDLNKQVVQLNSQAYSLNYENRDLNTKLQLQQKEVQLLTDYAKKLKDKCGNSCSTITR